MAQRARALWNLATPSSIGSPHCRVLTSAKQTRAEQVLLPPLEPLKALLDLHKRQAVANAVGARPRQ